MNIVNQYHLVELELHWFCLVLIFRLFQLSKIALHLPVVSCSHGSFHKLFPSLAIEIGRLQLKCRVYKSFFSYLLF